MYVEDRLAVAESLAEDQILRFGILCVRPEAILMRGIPFVQDSPVEEQIVVGREHVVITGDEVPRGRLPVVGNQTGVVQMSSSDRLNQGVAHHLHVLTDTIECLRSNSISLRDPLRVFEEPQHAFKVVRPMSGEHLLGTGAETSLDRSLIETGITEDWIARDTESVSEQEMDAPALRKRCKQLLVSQVLLG